ncbi:hypothetical protein D9M68_733800 [compost metagenome]
MVQDLVDELGLNPVYVSERVRFIDLANNVFVEDWRETTVVGKSESGVEAFRVLDETDEKVLALGFVKRSQKLISHKNTLC